VKRVKLGRHGSEGSAETGGGGGGDEGFALITGWGVSFLTHFFLLFFHLFPLSFAGIF